MIKAVATFLFLLGIAVLPVDGQESQKANELVVAFSPTKLVLDPLHSFMSTELQISTAIYEGLVSYHPSNLRPVPGVAYRWDISDDGLIYRFHLRPAAAFSDGQPVTAQDFRESWLRILDPEVESEYSFLFDVIKGAPEYRKGTLRDPGKVGIRAVSDHVLEVELAQPASHFLNMLCHMSFVPVPAELRKKTVWGRHEIVGNGPFAITKWTDEELVLEKNPHYWHYGNVWTEGIRILFIDNEQAITRGLNDGSIHWADDGDTSLLEDADLIQFFGLFGTSYLFFKSDVAPWNEPRVRRGLALMLPWQRIREESSAFTTDRLVPALEFLPEVKGIEDDGEEEGRQLLGEAGFPDGRGLPPVRILVPSQSAAEVAAGLMAESWRSTLSLKVDVRAVDYETYRNELKKREFTIASTTWIGDFADPLTFLQMWTTGSNLNDADYRNPVFDSLVTEASAQTGEMRYEKLAEAESLLLRDAVVMPLSHPPALHLVNTKIIAGWYPNPLDIHPFKYIRFKRYRLPPDVASR